MMLSLCEDDSKSARLVFYLNRFLATWKQSPNEIVKAAGDAILKSDFIVNHKEFRPHYLIKSIYQSTLPCHVK